VLTKAKDKVQPRTGHESIEGGGGKGIALLFFNLGARWGGWLMPCPPPLYPRERPSTHSLYGKLGGPKGRCGCTHVQQVQLIVEYFSLTQGYMALCANVARTDSILEGW
jgi:hypothetical protein